MPFVHLFLPHFLGIERLGIVTCNLREGHDTQLLSIIRPQSVGHSRLFAPSLTSRLDLFPGYFTFHSHHDSECQLSYSVSVFLCK